MELAQLSLKKTTDTHYHYANDELFNELKTTLYHQIIIQNDFYH